MWSGPRAKVNEAEICPKLLKIVIVPIYNPLCFSEKADQGTTMISSKKVAIEKTA